MEMLSLEKELKENSYPGRGIVIGRSAYSRAVNRRPCGGFRRYFARSRKICHAARFLPLCGTRQRLGKIRHHIGGMATSGCGHPSRQSRGPHTASHRGGDDGLTRYRRQRTRIAGVIRQRILQRQPTARFRGENTQSCKEQSGQENSSEAEKQLKAP